MGFDCITNFFRDILRPFREKKRKKMPQNNAFNHSITSFISDLDGISLKNASDRDCEQGKSYNKDENKKSKKCIQKSNFRSLNEICEQDRSYNSNRNNKSRKFMQKSKCRSSNKDCEHLKSDSNDVSKRTFEIEDHNKSSISNISSRDVDSMNQTNDQSTDSASSVQSQNTNDSRHDSYESLESSLTNTYTENSSASNTLKQKDSNISIKRTTSLKKKANYEFSENNKAIEDQTFSDSEVFDSRKFTLNKPTITFQDTKKLADYDDLLQGYEGIDEHEKIMINKKISDKMKEYLDNDRI